ncbi:peptidoglycan-associated lipoprotein Pal [Sphingobium boeckii]|uniref:Peptidoglycan-associated lipoprotein n=1 Tax=Sphingobium boeckii TaxID=1082345 RepID=A0A7W9AKW8_9SPHN|nr:peptidoglycan-associated lipoprotein Pal [Sphingobium boeckii]MBB5687584.1 peptidoglycan-associated lipoprotein [Sphingobium boeckii]
MARLATKLILTASLLAVAACGKKEVADAPPPPVDNSTGTEVVDTGVDNVPVPGSQGDFLAKVSSDRVFFGLDEDVLTDDDRATLDSQVGWLQQYPNVRATIEGHCDERGTRDYNIALGDRRANAAKSYLISKGVAAGRLTTVSYGKERPDAVGSDESAWAQNRRAVTVTLG